MTLIAILLCIAIEHFFGNVDRLRNWHWLQGYANVLYGWLGRHGFWSGSVGVLLTLAVPLFVVALAFGWVYDGSRVMAALIGYFVLLFCLGPRDLHLELRDYREALLAGDGARIDSLTAALVGRTDVQVPERAQKVMEAALVAGNERYFAVCFWFGLLGPIGALLFRAVSELRAVSSSRSLEYSGTMIRLHAILNWVPSRLFALGFALSGSLTHALEAWQFRRSLTLNDNDPLLRAAGLGALQFDQAGLVLMPAQELQWLDEVEGLIGRTFMVGLTTLALLTLVGLMA